MLMYTKEDAVIRFLPPGNVPPVNIYERLKIVYGQKCVWQDFSVSWQSRAQVFWDVNKGVVHAEFISAGTII
jgi:hypothetical protein